MTLVTGDLLPGNGSALKLVEILDRFRAEIREDLRGIRDEFREDLADHEKRMTERVQEARNDVTEFVIEHGRAHELERESRKEAHERFDDFISQAQAKAAYNAGLMAFLLFLGRAVAKHPQLIVWALIGVGVILGSIKVSVG